jgi:signal transduction histidine kinase/DNA-binding response OmpR family regulator
MTLAPTGDLFQHFETEIAQVEYTRHKLLLSVLLLGFSVFTLNFLLQFYGILPAEDHQIYLLSMLWLVGFIAYELIILLVIRNDRQKNKKISTRFRLIHSLLEVTFPSILLFFLIDNHAILRALDSQVIFLYYFFITLSVLHLDFRFNLVVGTVGALQYAFIIFYGFNYTSPLPEHTPVLPVSDYYIRCLLQIVAGAAAGFVAEELKKRIKSTLEIQYAKDTVEAKANQYHALNNLKSRFFANISHEFRTPLTLLLAPIKNRLEKVEEPTERQELSMMHRYTTQLLNLVNELLDLSKLEAETLKLKPRRGNLVAFMNLLADQFQSLANSKQISFQIAAPEQNIFLLFDPVVLEKIFRNLLSNAFKFTPDGGEIKLEITRAAQAQVLIRVQDSGIGIAPEHLQKIFDRFYQVDSSLDRQYEGTGIGLSLTKELVELHQGTIEVESSPGKGSNFSVRIPLESPVFHPEESPVNESEPAYVPESVAAILVDKAPTTIAPQISPELADTVLVVEDNADLRQFLATNLRPHFKVLEACNGQEGIRIGLQEVPDLIISDLMMPVTHGLQLCQELKSDDRTSHIPIILLTARVDAESRLQGYQLRADDYMPKPFELPELLARVKNLIEGRKLLREKYRGHLMLGLRQIEVESMDERFLRKCLALVEAHLTDEGFGVDILAREIGMSPTQLYRKLRALTGQVPNEFIRSLRLKRAAELLTRRMGNVAEVAYEVGFSNLSYFAKCFREKYGVSPSEFLQKEGNI